MFKFLKEKIKGALSKITKSVEEESAKEEVKEQFEEKNEIKEESKVKDIKKDTKTKSKKNSEKKHKEKATKEHKNEKKKIHEVIEEKQELKEEIVIEEPKEEKIEGVKIIYFVHGTTIDNEKGISTGQAQGELSELGKKQAIELKNKINIKDFDFVFVSDLKRAIDSANLTFKNSKIIEDKRLRECDYGDLNQTSEENVVYLDHINEKFPNGESLKDVEKRIVSFLNYLFENYNGEKIAIVSHKAPQLALEVLLNKKTWEQSINEDWRLKKNWQPGWEYNLSNKFAEPITEEKKGFFTKLKEKFISKEPEEIKEEFREVKLEKEEKIIEEIKPQEEAKSEGKKGFFGIIKEKITTTKISEEKFEDLFYDLEVALLENNVAFEVVDKIKTDLKNDLVDKPIKRGDVENQVVNSLKESIEDLFLTPKINLIEKIKEKNEKPYVICFVGQNGSGKTTSISKLGNLLKEKGISVVFAAADTFRAAAIQQIKEWGEKLSIKVIAHDYGSDPAAVAFDAISYAKSHKIDVVLIDTAGRQHSNLNLMKELEKIVRVSKPDLKIFVGESLVGSDAVLQAQDYNKSIGIDGIILTKADVDEKGGAIISVSYVTHRPIMYLGIGQSLNDLQEFDSEKVVEGLGL